MPPLESHKRFQMSFQITYREAEQLNGTL
jgi:hypothetical protein